MTTKDSEPEPDVVAIRGDRRQYADRHPGPQDVVLIVEVADSSLRRDRVFKKRLYAAAGILVYWVVNLPEARIEVYTDPSGPIERPDYHQRRDYGQSDTVPVLIDGVEVGRLPVHELLP